jgi:transposase-like protein
MPDKRIAPSAHLRQALSEFLTQGIEQEESPTSALLGLAARLVLQEALEVEQRDALGRERYQRGSEGRYRNGYRPGHVEGAEGRVKVEVPQVRGIAGYSSTLMGFLEDHSEVLQRLAIEMYARGLSTRDIEAAFTDATGRCLVSRSAVSEMTDTLWEEYEAFCQRDLGQFEVIYLFVDGVYESLRRQSLPRARRGGGPKEALLCAWGILADGRRVPLHLALGNRESYEGWLEFLRDLVARGLAPPLAMTSDGAPGMLRALDEVFPLSVRIRCWMHKMQNVLGKLPEAARARVKAELQAVRDYLFCPEAIAAAIAAARETVKRHAPKAKGRTGKQAASDRRAQVEREIENVLAAVRAGGNDGAAALLRGELDRLTAERDRLAQQQDNLGDNGLEKALKSALAALPAVVEEHLGHGDLAELTDPGRVAQARALLSELVSSITVLPDQANGGYTCTVTGDLSGVLRLAGDKRAMVSSDGSPGGLLSVLQSLDPPPVQVELTGRRGTAVAVGAA